MDSFVTINHGYLKQYMVNFNPTDKVYECQVTILPKVYTKESVLPIRDKPYHTNKRNIQKVEVIEILRNYAFTSSP